ncbi:hypothetical protein [Achromobacter xylosoxidans]|uniref:hypothetical protein n=1 Tax=Alcaligenes xylosoxydans xylosoxydans TaxID=85698 RepID=UPI00190FC85D|nr:hypothetical protein [Achromobacter xylosoxidans]MCH4588088.1 hypothetical protein [Achromobacter xylosoxidans]QQE57662.1 hypothetical protein I6H41_01095 [Achromobacter xylosoxidans]
MKTTNPAVAAEEFSESKVSANAHVPQHAARTHDPDDSRHFLKPDKQRNKNSKKSEKTICTV